MATNRQPQGPQETAVFVDGNWLLHRVSYSKGANSSKPTKVVPLNVLNYCCIYALERGATFGALLFDGPNNFRYKVYPEYKKNRGGRNGDIEDTDDTHDAVYASLAPTAELFNMVGFPVVQIDEYEADDLVSSGANAFVSNAPNRFSWMVGRDKDGFQSIRDNIGLYWPKVGIHAAQLLMPEDVVRKKGMRPAQFGDYQILTGDGVDSIPPVTKPKEAKKILEQHGSLREFFSTSEGKRFYSMHASELVRNLQLVRMDNSSWRPADHEIRLSNLREPASVLSAFGKLPQSFYALRSAIGSGARSLF